MRRGFRGFATEQGSTSTCEVSVVFSALGCTGSFAQKKEETRRGRGKLYPLQSFTWNMKMMRFPIGESPSPGVDFQVNHVKLQGCIFIFASLLKEHELVFGCRWNLITTCLPIVQHCHGNVHHLQIYLCVCVCHTFCGKRMENEEFPWISSLALRVS